MVLREGRLSALHCSLSPPPLSPHWVGRHPFLLWLLVFSCCLLGPPSPCPVLPAASETGAWTGRGFQEGLAGRVRLADLSPRRKPAGNVGEISSTVESKG